MVHQKIRPASDTLAGLFFCVKRGGKACEWCTIPYGAGSCCAAVQLAFASRGPVAKNSALHCFLNAPADGAPGNKTCERFRLWVFFAIGKCFRPDRWAAGVLKAERTVGGPARQAPTSKRRSGGRNKACLCRYKADEEVVLAYYIIVIPQGFSGGAEPHPYNEP